MEFYCTCPICRFFSTNLHIKELNFNEIFDNEQKICSICLEEFCVGEKLSVLLCNHIFHKECIKPWIKQLIRLPVINTIDNRVVILVENSVVIRPQISRIERFVIWTEENFECCVMLIFSIAIIMIIICYIVYIYLKILRIL